MFEKKSPIMSVFSVVNLFVDFCNNFIICVPIYIFWTTVYLRKIAVKKLVIGQYQPHLHFVLM